MTKKRKARRYITSAYRHAKQQAVERQVRRSSGGVVYLLPPTPTLPGQSLFESAQTFFNKPPETWGEEASMLFGLWARCGHVVMTDKAPGEQTFSLADFLARVGIPVTVARKCADDSLTEVKVYLPAAPELLRWGERILTAEEILTGEMNPPDAEKLVKAKQTRWAP